MWKLFKILLFILLILIGIQIFQCERKGGLSNFIADIIVGTEQIIDNTKEKIGEKRQERQ